MSQTVQRFKNKRRRDWRDPFEWFQWYFTTVSPTVDVVRISEDLIIRLAEDGVIRYTE